MTFEQGEMIGLVAPNGTGKSTFMNVLMNYVKPMKGKVVFKDGISYSNKSNEVKIHSFVSMMPDQSDLYNHLSGREHLKMFATMWQSDLKLIDETIEILNMGHYVNKKQARIPRYASATMLCYANSYGYGHYDDGRGDERT